MFKGIVFFVFVGQMIFASTEDSLCWQKEENPANKTPYTSYWEWESDVSQWQKKQKPQLNVVKLLKAFKIFKAERDKANSFGNDKKAHCYVGCRISQGTDFKTARFVAWFKEIQDLTDCKMESHFEIADYDATLVGAEAGNEKAADCEVICLKVN